MTLKLRAGKVPRGGEHWRPGVRPPRPPWAARTRLQHRRGERGRGLRGPWVVPGEGRVLMKSCGDSVTVLHLPVLTTGLGAEDGSRLPKTEEQACPQRSLPRGARSHPSQFTLRNSQSSKILLDPLVHNSAILTACEG